MVLKDALTLIAQITAQLKIAIDLAAVRPCLSDRRLVAFFRHPSKQKSASALRRSGKSSLNHHSTRPGGPFATIQPLAEIPCSISAPISFSARTTSLIALRISTHRRDRIPCLYAGSAFPGP